MDVPLHCMERKRSLDLKVTSLGFKFPLYQDRLRSSGLIVELAHSRLSINSKRVGE